MSKNLFDNNDCRCPGPVPRRVDLGDRASLSSLLSLGGSYLSAWWRWVGWGWAR